jgi:ERCC4-related helicase
MSVAQQKKILENMQKKQYHIVVATAVAGFSLFYEH